MDEIEREEYGEQSVGRDFRMTSEQRKVQSSQRKLEW